jgi:[ribosomal protein S5]-alanine N-acetyltransferase
MRTYFLTTERLGFSTWDINDLPEALTLWGDPEVTRFLVVGGMMSTAEVRERLCQEIANFRKYKFQYYPVFVRPHDKFVGCCGLRPIDGDLRHLEMGVHLIREKWGEGIATEACAAVIGYAFDRLQADRLFAGHHPQNPASPRLLVHLGFRFMEDKYYPPTGLMHPSYILRKSDRLL